MSDLFTTGIRPALDNYLSEKSQERRSYGKYWSASSAGYCMRLNILKRLDIPCVPEIAEDALRTTRVFEAGHIFHEWVQRITKNAGLSIAQELELQDEDLLVRGHIDDLVLIDELGDISDTMKIINTDNQSIKNRHLILYDYKTANSQAFNYKRDEIGHYHKMQLGTYMYMLRKGGKKHKDAYPGLSDLNEARILQISKDDLRMREQQLFWSDELEQQVVSYWRRIQAHWDKKILPPCTCLEHDGGFLGKRSKKGKIYNPYFLNDVPCSEEWIRDKLPKEWRLT